MDRNKWFRWDIIVSMALSCIVLFLISCGEKSTDPAQRIIDQAIKVHGSKVFDHSTVEFKYRDRHFKSSRLDGQYRYEQFWDSTGIIVHDELSNTGFTRYFGQLLIVLDPRKIDGYINAINTVFYFFALPFNLNDPPVIKELLGEVTLLDQRYDKIKVTFKPNPGDKLIHNDVYVFWINKSNHYIDYLGYSYAERGETIIQFRQAINRRKINELTVQDYIIFKPINDSAFVQIPDLDQLWAGNQLKEFSRVINESVKVTLKK